MRRSGDGFIRCGDGHVRWGVFGAAGVVFVYLDGDEWRVLLQKRSAWSHEGGTWSCPGGALDEGESSFDGAMREAEEEIGLPPGVEVLGECVFAPADDWSYTTIVARVAGPFGLSLNFESEAMAWLAPHEVDRLTLHAGFAAAWGQIQAILRSAAA